MLRNAEVGTEPAELQCGHLRTFLLTNVNVPSHYTENYRPDANKC